MRQLYILIVVFVSSLSGYSNPVTAQKPESVLRVGISPAPPFIIMADNKVEGVCADLWGHIADSLDIRYTLVSYPDYLSLMKALKDKEIDLTINPVTLTDYRLVHYRMTIPFYTSRLAVAERADHSFPVFRVIKILVHWKTLRLFLVLLVVVLVFSSLMWLAERKANKRQFRRGIKGIADGIWWSFVTMTTVGYGDKVPRSTAGRILTIVWMFYAIALFFLVTAEISSELTVFKLQEDISSMEDLRKSKVGTLTQTGYASLCEINDIPYVPYSSLETGLQAVVDNNIQVFLYDAVVLDYYIGDKNLTEKLIITPSRISEQYFCFVAHKQQTDQVDQINVVMLNILESPLWTSILESYHIDQ